MTKSELLEQRALIDAQIAALEVREPWRAELGAGYYYNDCDGATFWCREAGHRSDDYRHKTGNYFRTEELAEAAEAKRMKRLPQTLARELLLDVQDECGGFDASELAYSFSKVDGQWGLTTMKHFRGVIPVEFRLSEQNALAFLSTPGVTDALDVLFGGKS